MIRQFLGQDLVLNRRIKRLHRATFKINESHNSNNSRSFLENIRLTQASKGPVSGLKEDFLVALVAPAL
jgi:hypothetical protein